MPALYTHYSFGEDVLNKLNKNISTNIKNNLEYYNMFNQGFDNLYYYLKKWNYYRNFGVNAHKHNIDLFFRNMFNYIKKNNLEHDSTVTNMIYGFINHYTLDTLLHPFINYQVKNLDIPHTKIEFMLDYYLFLKRNNNKKWQTKIYKTLIPKVKFNNNLINTINYTFYKSYNEKNIGKIFNKSHNNGYYIYRYFINDLSGIKTTLYKLVDYILHMKDFKLHKNTFNKQLDLRILNTDNNYWHHPKNIKETYNYSIKELYNYALKICIKLNTLAYEVLNNKKELNEFIEFIKKIDIKNIQQFLEQ